MPEKPKIEKPASPRLSAVRPSRSRVVVEGVEPEIDCGRFPIKRTVGDEVIVEADVFIDGHEALSCALLHRRKGASRWNETLMTPLDNDRWLAVFNAEELGRYEYTVVAWHDPFKGWRRDLEKRIAADQNIDVDLLIGADLVAATAERAKRNDKKQLEMAAAKLREQTDESRQAALDEQLADAMTRYTDREHQTEYERVLEVVVDPERARFSTWYEMFPRSAADGVRHGTFKDVEEWLPHVASLGFDVLYFPPIHPIGTTFRKGKNNTLTPDASDVGSPWAIGAPEGGHKDIHSELGSLEDFQRLLKRAKEFGIDIALDIAFQVAPDHPYVSENESWFRKRPDGTIQYAENPPKKYQDIYPFDFETVAAKELWGELRSVFEYWAQQGVRVFRVDNPHTKPFAFWEWCINSLKAAYPDLIFLSEAFTRPKVMYRLAKLGFTQSYTYFAWRYTKHDFTEYFTELTQTKVREFFRPNLWPNTPDILTEQMQKGGRPVFMQRITLAATLGASYGIYGPTYENIETAPLQTGSEEYLHSEKYQLRKWDLNATTTLAPFIAKLNRARRENPALQRDDTLRFHRIENENIIAYSKTAPPDNIILTVVNLDPKWPQSGWVHIPLQDFGIAEDEPFTVHDVLRDEDYTWKGEWNYVELDARKNPAHVLKVVRDGVEDPLWYKDAIVYELHVRAYRDSNGDGLGDFQGLTSKLDYLEDLGVTALWILPFYPSPWRDDGYDIADYTSVHPAYGTTRDFKEFMAAAHDRGLKVITELVVNHTSDQHPWFQAARKAPVNSAQRDFYVWSDNADKYRDARIIFKDFESSNWAWDPVARQYFWHRFYAHQPDLNFDNPAVHKALFRVLDFWMRMGVDGMRLDAIPYLYEREGTNCENLPPTHDFLKLLRQHVDKRFKARMLLAEANQWPEETVPYFGDGDECHMSFHFPVMPRLFMAIRMEDRFPIIDILEQTPPIPENTQWAIFLRNHDELTLEMVTDEERDYMYRTYASDLRARINLGIRRRLAPLLGNDRRTIELMNCLLFSLPGTPVLYYGDEIGMGDNIYLGDRNGVRTPMQWSGDRNAGFSDANPQQLYLPAIIDPEYHFGTVNVEAQQANPNSLLWWMKRIIALRKRHKAFGRGTIEFLYPENRKVLAFLRQYEDETILVVVNLSRLVQYIDLDLKRFAGMVPTELFGRTQFPTIDDDPFMLTLGPHSFYWFELTQSPVTGHQSPVLDEWRPPVLRAAGLTDLLEGASQRELGRLLRQYLPRQRWFRSKARAIRDVEIVDTIPIDVPGCDARIAVVEVDYPDGDPENYLVPLITVSAERAKALGAVPICELRDAAESPMAIDASFAPEFGSALLALIQAKRRFTTERGTVVATPMPALREHIDGELAPRLLGVEQSNTSIAFDGKLMLKLYRRLEEGRGLDLEVGRFLTKHGFPHAPRVLGAIEYDAERHTSTLAVMHAFTPNEGDAWEFTIDTLGSFYERAAAREEAPPTDLVATAKLLEQARKEPTTLARELVGSYLEDARLIGERTAELHNVLASDPDDPDFAPEPFTVFYQRSLYQSMRNLTGRVFHSLSKQSGFEDVATLQGEVLTRFRKLIDDKINGIRIRTHGDFHLGQLLYTGKDFVITDFEGEPLHPLSERRLKRSPLRDVAGMVRSFQYAAYAPLIMNESGVVVRDEDRVKLERWAEAWYAWVSASFLGGYFKAVDPKLLPPTTAELETLLDAYLLEKAIYELGYELNNRPDWLQIPMRGLLELLGRQPA